MNGSDPTPLADKPLWPLSSYGPMDEPTLLTGIDESPEELRFRAFVAQQAGNAAEYVSPVSLPAHMCIPWPCAIQVRYETIKFSAAEQVYTVFKI